MSFLSSSFALSSHLYLQPLRYVSSFSSSYSPAHTLSFFIPIKWFLFFSWTFLSASQPRENLIFICLIGGTPVSPHFVDSSLFPVLSAFSSIVADPSQVFSGKRSRAWHPLRTRDLLINMATSGGQAARHKETSRVEPLSTVYTAHGAFKAALFLASDVSSIRLFRFLPVCHLSLCYMLTFVSSTIAPRTCYSGHGIGLFICTCTLVRIQKLMQFIQSSEPRSIH